MVSSKGCLRFGGSQQHSAAHKHRTKQFIHSGHYVR
ncbi:conserved hypothetical protein [Vibrio cholerae MO10]|uniref:Uncharacterized protein n=1 Tax=Vibrio cholerae (strain MO10) TaxID=345072 RepID=A0A0X1L545_VIBCO|nr:conserved hypothetical protein [Vibrio cholerae MO10]